MRAQAEVITLEDIGMSANELLTIKQAGDLLERHYPGHGWMVGIRGGVMDIRPMSAPVGNWVYTIKLLDSHSSSDLDRKVLNAGGAFLEVLRQRRGAANDDTLSSLKLDVAGRHRLEL